MARGFSIVAAIFILVVLSGLAAFIVSVTSNQNLSLAQSFESARAYQAARAGVEWGIANLLNNGACSGGSLTFTDADLSRFTTTITAIPSVGGGKTFCSISATASPTGATAGSIGYVERNVLAVVERNY